MPDFLIPVLGLELEEPWPLGAVNLLDAASAHALVADHASADADDWMSEAARDFVNDQVVAMGHVQAETPAAALDLLATALDLLRVYQQANTFVQTTMFGLPGEVQQAKVDYVVLSDNHAGRGWKRRGQSLGWKYESQNVREFGESPGFLSAANAIGKEVHTEGERRALLGIQLASRAILEHRPGLRLLNVMMAAETLLLTRQRFGQSLLLAQRSVFFLCGAPEGEMCGRARPTCLALALSPANGADRQALSELRKRGDTDYRWRCSEWHHVLDWYDGRSEVVHGGGEPIDAKEASRALWWLVHDLLPQCLEWFAAHPDEPLEALKDAISGLPDPPDWEAVIANGPQP